MNPSSHSYTSFKGNKLLAKALLGSASWLMMNIAANATNIYCPPSLSNSGTITNNGSVTEAAVNIAPNTTCVNILNNSGGIINGAGVALDNYYGNVGILVNMGSAGNIINYGIIEGYQTALLIRTDGSAGASANVDSINNYGTIIATGSGFTTTAIKLQKNSYLNNLTNSGSITNSIDAAIRVSGSTINSILNAGSITAGGGEAGINVYNDGASGIHGKINEITNTGSITSAGNRSTGIRINNDGSSLGTLNNLQGQYGSGGTALLFQGKLPTNYNIMIDGQKYGQMSASSNPADGASLAGSTTFGVYALTDTRKLQQGKVYSSVLSGVPTANLNNTTGKVGDRGTFTLRENGANTWDMTIDGLWTPVIGYMNPNVANTYTAVSANRDAVSGAIHQRYAVLNAVMEYDCSRFDKYGVCLSFQARATGWGDQTTGAGVFNIAKRITENVRAGVYLDYQAAQATPFATNGYNGGIQWGYNNPTFGGYVGWSDKADGTGIQARVSGGYNPGKITVNRAMLDYAEPGSGTAGLNAYYAYGVAGYGVSVGNGIIVTPYGGLRYTDVTRNAYTENFVPGWVLFPLAYNAYYEQLITGLTGAKVQAMLTDKFGVNVALGGEFDFNRNANGYGGYSYAPGMEAWGVNHGGSWNGVRPAGIIGAFYDVNKNDRLMLNAYVGEQAWSSRTYTNLLAGYQVAF